MNLKLNALSMAMIAKGSKIRSLVSSLEIKKNINRPTDYRIASANTVLLSAKNMKEYVFLTAEYCKLASDMGVSLLAFPPYYGDQAIFCTPFADNLIDSMITAKEELYPDERYLSKLVKNTESYVREIYFNTFSCLSESYGIYIASGSMVVTEGSELKSRSYLFDPEGKIILTQDKLFLNDTEKKLGVISGTNINIATTPLGKIAILTVDDLAYFEPFMLAKHSGADIVIVSGIKTEQELLLARIRSEQNRLVLISAAYSQSSIEEIPTQGGGNIVVPHKLSENRDGILLSFDQSPISITKIRSEMLESQFDQYNGDQNTEHLRRMWRGRDEDNLH